MRYRVTGHHVGDAQGALACNSNWGPAELPGMALIPACRDGFDGPEMGVS